jgi:hypothetical protein
MHFHFVGLAAFFRAPTEVSRLTNKSHIGPILHQRAGDTAPVYSSRMLDDYEQLIAAR